MKLFQELINLLKQYKSMPIKYHLNGKEINLTSDNTIIKSTNFNVDKNGNMTCKNGKFTGGNVNLTDNGLGNYEGKLRIQGNEFINGSYSEGIAIRKIGSTANSISKQSIFLHMYEGEPCFSMNGTSHNIADFRESGIGFNLKNDVIFNVSGVDKQAGLYNITQFYVDGGITTPKLQITNAGYAMHGMDTSHIYKCHWTGSRLQFWVDETNVGTLSDKRLKTEIQDIDENFIKAIKEVEMKQFKIANRNGLVSFGILAQDLIEIFKKYNKNPFDYEIVQETQYRTDDDTIYYTINYEQYLILKSKAQEQEIKELQEKDKQKNNLIQSLIERIEKLEAK